jgi:dethiobiotin synthetase
VRGCFVTGTDTGVGKTVLAAAIVAALRAGGVRTRPVKPVLTGLEEPSGAVWPHDHELLARAAGCDPGTVALRRYDPPVSPHLAAELAGRPIDPPRLARETLAAASDGETLIVEGVGGLLVPLGEGWDVRRFASALGLPLIVAARAGLGTINHTLLTLEAARAGGLPVAGVVLTPWPASPGRIERSNVAAIAELGEVEVRTLPLLPDAGIERLAAAGAGLPLARWLAPSAR